MAKKTAKNRVLSVVLAAAMLIGFIPAGLVTTAYAEGSDPAPAVNRDAFGIAMDGALTEDEVSQLMADNPYGTEEWFPLFTANELFYVEGHEGGRYWRSRDYDGGTFTNVRGSGRLIGSKDEGNGSGFTMMDTAPFDLNSTGSKEYVATVAYWAGGDKLELFVTDENGDRVTNTYDLASGGSINNLDDVSAYATTGFVSVAAGDFDGDGKETMIVYIPRMENDAPAIAEYKVENGTISWVRDVLGTNVFDLLGNENLYQARTKAERVLRNTPHVQILAEDVDNDNIDEVIITAGMHDTYDPVGSGVDGNGMVGSQLFIYDLHNPLTDNAAFVQTFKTALSEGGPGIANASGRLRFASSSVGNVTTTSGGTDYPEIISAGWIDSDGGNGIGLDGKKINFNQITCTKTTYNETYGTAVGSYSHSSLGSVNTKEFVYGGFYDDSVEAIVPVQVFSPWGASYADAIFAGGVVYKIENGQIKELYHRDYFDDDDDGINESIITNGLIIDVTAGNFTNDPDGREQLVFATMQKRQIRNQYFSCMYSYTCDEGSHSDPGAGWNSYDDGWLTYKKGDAFITLCAPDLDSSDSTVVKIKNVTRTYTEPEVLAILEASPYFEEIPDSINNSETVYGKSDTTGTGTGSSNSLLTNVVAGFEWSMDDIFAGFACGAGFEATIENNFTWSTSEEQYETFEVNYANDSGENAVIVYRRPVIAYEYEVRGSDKNLVLAKEGELSTSMITVEAYNEAAAQYGLDPIPEGLLGEPGNPFSYRSTKTGLENVATKDNNTTQYNGTGTITQSFTNGTSTSTEYEYELNTSFTAYGLVFGAKVGGGAGYAHTTSESTVNTTEISKTGTVSGVTEEGYDFQWQFAHWNTTINGTVIPILGYIVKDVVAPPSPPTDLGVDSISTTSATISWQHGSRPAEEYRIYQYFPANDKYIQIASVDGTETSCVISNLLPDNTYTVVVRAYSTPTSTGIGIGGESVNSEALSFSTTPEGATPIEIDGADDVSVKVGADAVFAVDVSLPGSKYTTVDYQWQVRESGGSWIAINKADSTSLTLENVTQSMDGNLYRCEISALYSGSLITYYSDAGKLNVGKAAAETALTVSGYTGGSGTVAAPYTGKSDYLVQSGTDSKEVKVNQNATVTHGEIKLLVYGTSSTTGEGTTIGAPYYGYDSANDCYYALTEKNGTYTVDGQIVKSVEKVHTDIANAAVTAPADFNSAMQISKTVDTDTYYLFADVTGTTKTPIAGVTDNPATADEDETVKTVDTRLAAMTGITYYWMLDGKVYAYGENGAVGNEVMTGVSLANLYDVYVKGETDVVLGRGETYTVSEEVDGVTEYEDVEEFWYYSVAVAQITEGDNTTTTYTVIPFTETETVQYKVGETVVHFSADKLTLVTMQTTTTVEVPVYSSEAGTTLSLSAKASEQNGGAIPGALVTFRIVNTVTGAVEEIKAAANSSGDATATWRAPETALYSIEAAVNPSETYLGATSEAKFYDALGTPITASEVEYRLLLTSGSDALTGSMPFSGTFSYKLQSRGVGDSEWADYSDSDSDTFTYTVTAPGAAEAAVTGGSYTPTSAGNHTVKVYRGSTIDATKIVAAASLNVTRLAVTITPTWTVTPSSADSVTLASTYNVHTNSYLKTIFEINCPYFTTHSAAGIFNVTLSYRSDAASKAAVDAFKNNFQVTLASDSFTIKPNSAPVYFSSGENGKLVGRSGENLFLMASGSSQISGTKLTFNAEPVSGYAVDKWIINGTDYDAAVHTWATVSDNTLTINSFDASETGGQTMDGALTVEVTFESAANLVTYSVSGNVGGSISAVVDDGNNTSLVSGTSVAKGADIILTAAPADGYVVDHWVVNGENYTWDSGDKYAGKVLSIPDVEENYTIVVYYTESTATYSVTTSVYSEAGNPASELATISAANAETGEPVITLTGLEKNTSITFTANLNQTNNTVKEWQTSTDGTTFTTVSGSGGQTSFTLYNLNGNTHVRAIVTTAQSYTLSFEVKLGNETVTNTDIASLAATSNGADLTSGNSYSAYIPVEFALTLHDHYYIVGWSQNVTPNASGKNAQLSSLDENVGVTVTIAEKPVITFSGDSNITVTATQGDTVLTSGDHVEYNSNPITFTATPATGYETDSWTVAPDTSDPSNADATRNDVTVYTVNGEITSNVTVSVTAKAIPTYTITLATEAIDAGGAHGTISANVTRKELADYTGTPASGGSFYRDSDITITATPETGYRVKTYTWTVNGTSGSGAVLPENLLKNVQGAVSITVRFVQIGSGISFDPVDPASDGGYISAATAAGMDVLENANGLTLENGVDLALTATLKPGYEVAGWYANGTIIDGTAGQTQYTYTSNGNDETALTVQFRQVLYTVNTQMDNGSIAVATLTEGKARGGEVLTFTATPDSGYAVTDWTVNGVSQSVSGNTFNWTVPNGKAADPAVDTFTVKAVTARGSYTVTYTDSTGGSLSSATASGSYVANNGTVTITATPSTGYTFGSWKVNGSPYNETSNPLTLTITSDTTVEAVFVPDTYTVTFATTGKNGTISATADGSPIRSGSLVNHNAELVITVTPSGTNMVNQWTIDGTIPDGYAMTDTADAALRYTTTVTNAVDISVEFVECPTYTITVTAGTNGSVSKNSISVSRNGSASVTATPDAYYQFDKWTVDGTPDDVSGATLTLSSIKKDMTVSASFKEAIRYDVTFSVVYESGSSNSSSAAVTASGTTIYPTATEPVRVVGNSTLVFTASPAMNGGNNDDMVASWSVNGVVQENLSNVLTIEKLTTKTDVVLTFKPYAGYTIPTSGDSYTISDVVRTPADTAPATEIRKGGSIEFTVKPKNDADVITAIEQIKGGTGSAKQNDDGSWTVIIKDINSEISIEPTIVEGKMIKIDSLENGSVVVKKGDTVLIDGDVLQYGDQITIKATANSGYQLDSLTVNSTAFQNGGTYTVAGNEANNQIFISAAFSERPVISGGGGGGGGASIETGNIIIVKPTNGTVTTDPKEKAEQGDTVIITTVPDKCYKTGSVIVTDQSGEQIEVTKQEDGTYAFEMPGEKVTVKVNFIIDFIDVNESNYFSAAVDWAVENTITTGTSATMFSPYMICTRAQAVTFLWRAAGSPTPKSSEIPFEDMAAGAYYYNAVLWAMENNITLGTSATTFDPDAHCTRAQIVTFLWRAAGSPTLESSEMLFGDVAAGAYYYAAVLWAVENNITLGTSATTFSPNADCTRAQIVTFLWRCLGGEE